jgi:hypothetical protein
VWNKSFAAAKFAATPLVNRGLTTVPTYVAYVPAAILARPASLAGGRATGMIHPFPPDCAAGKI